MKAFKCDRCGKLYEQRAEKEEFLIGKISHISKVYSYLDLCDMCNQKLETWMKNKRGMMRKELQEYELVYIFDKTQEGKCIVKAENLSTAIYEFYCSHGFRYKVTNWSVPGCDFLMEL